MCKAVCHITTAVRSKSGLTDMFCTVGMEVNFYYDGENIVINDEFIANPGHFLSRFEPDCDCDWITFEHFEYVISYGLFASCVTSVLKHNSTRSIVIQDYSGAIVFITVNKEGDRIRVSYEDKQEVYSSYIEAIRGIRDKYYTIV